jgi:acyl dehydratase
MDVPAPSRALVRAYREHVGAPAGEGPPAHMFPQWGFPVASRAMKGVPYPLLRVMNAGCVLTVNGELPPDAPLRVRARVESIDDNGQRAVITQRIVTGTAENDSVLDARVLAYVKLKGSDRNASDKPASEREGVPADAQVLGTCDVHANAGRDFALLTGDFNPIHWVGPYARAAGFRGCILHGFATFARAIEITTRTRGALRSVDVRFTRPVSMPNTLTVHALDTRVWVTDARGTVCMAGSFALQGDPT